MIKIPFLSSTTHIWLILSWTDKFRAKHNIYVMNIHARLNFLQAPGLQGSRALVCHNYAIESLLWHFCRKTILCKNIEILKYENIEIWMHLEPKTSVFSRLERMCHFIVACWGVGSIGLLVGEVVTGVSGRSLKSRVATLAAAAAAGQEQQHKTHSRVQAGSMAIQA